MPTINEIAAAGARAIESYFAGHNTTPVTAGDGRFTVYIPGGDAAEGIQLSLASTPAARGILARAKARRIVANTNLSRIGLVINQWNRSSPMPHAVLATRGEGADSFGTIFLEGFLPPGNEIDETQVSRFIETVVAGSRQFWSSPAVQNLTQPAGRSQPSEQPQAQ